MFTNTQSQSQNQNQKGGLVGKKNFQLKSFSAEQIETAMAVGIVGVLAQAGFVRNKAGFWVKVGSESISVKSDKWCFKKSGEGGKGAITLRQELAQESFPEAIKSLLENKSFFPTNPQPAMPAVDPGKPKFQPSDLLPATQAARSYLSRRGIPPVVIEQAIKQGALAEHHALGPKNTALIHKNQFGELTGAEIRNDKFTSFGGKKSLFQFKNGSEVNVIVVAESAIDSLSYSTLFTLVSGIIVSTGGASSLEQREILVALLSHYPEADLIAAQDGDEDGDKQAAAVAALAEEAGRLCTRHRPTGKKDWNEILTSL